MGVNSLPKTVTRQRRGCDLNPGPSAPESSTLTTPLPSHPKSMKISNQNVVLVAWPLGELIAPPDPLAGFRKGKIKEERRRGIKKERDRERVGMNVGEREK